MKRLFTIASLLWITAACTHSQKMENSQDCDQTRSPDSAAICKAVINPAEVVSFGETLVQGKPTEIIYDQSQSPAYVIFGNQAVRLLERTSVDGKVKLRQIRGQGYVQHEHGFSSPIGKLKNWDRPMNEYSSRELRERFVELTDQAGYTTLEFQSGVVVRGKIKRIGETRIENERRPSVIVFEDGTCKVTLGDRVLFDPSWGTYDMLIMPAMQ
jgi:hypothetical protein